jgi:hypothetical protein
MAREKHLFTKQVRKRIFIKLFMTTILKCQVHRRMLIDNECSLAVDHITRREIYRESKLLPIQIFF